MKTSRRRSTGGRAARRETNQAGGSPRTVRGRQEASRADALAEPYRPELVARLEQAVREGRYAPDPRAIAAAMIDRMDALLG